MFEVQPWVTEDYSALGKETSLGGGVEDISLVLLSTMFVMMKQHPNRFKRSESHMH